MNAFCRRVRLRGVSELHLSCIRLHSRFPRLHVQRPGMRRRKVHGAVAHFERHPEVAGIPQLARMPDISHEDDRGCFRALHFQKHCRLRVIVVGLRGGQVPELRPGPGQRRSRGVDIRIRPSAGHVRSHHIVDSVIVYQRAALQWSRNKAGLLHAHKVVA